MSDKTSEFKYAPPRQDPIILYQDDDLVAISKPAGLLSVPGRQEHHRDCIQIRLETHLQQALGVVHRLDMDTSGIMLFAKTNAALKHLHRQFSDRTVKKQYLAWTSAQDVECRQLAVEGTVNQPLICDWPNRPKQIIDHDLGKPSQTMWKRSVSETLNHAAEFKLTPITGRSHQLRVHMAFLGCPILGDRFYGTGDASATRLMLHAHSIEFAHPQSGKALQLIDQTSENRLKQCHLVI